MNASTALKPVQGLVDEQGRLVEADAMLLRLQEQAGGVRGGTLAVPQLAALARLTRRLQIAISRRVVAACGDRDVDFLVKLAPQGDNVEFAITAWQEITPPAPPRVVEAMRWRDFSRAAADWIFETDAMLRITQAPAGVPAVTGQPLETLFRFAPDKDGGEPILAAVGRSERFDCEGVTFLIGFGVPVRVVGLPLIDGLGRLTGYQLLVSRKLSPHRAGEAADPPPLDDAFGTQLGRAMRKPLDEIIAHADMISSRSDGPVRRDYAAYANDIAGAGRHLLGLVEDLVDLQTIERADFRPEAEPVDLCDTAQRAAGLLSVRAAGKHLRIESLLCSQPVLARGDLRRILQILLNLLSNAIRHSPEHGAISIRCEREGDIVAVVIGDAGDGVDPDDHERIFQRFERLGLRDGTGSGLGLYISRRLARAMGGDLGVDSLPGDGARFVLTLPAA